MYQLINKEIRNKGNSYVTFRITERVQRICIWINQNFLLEEELDLETEETKKLHINLLCLRDHSFLCMEFGPDGQVKISTHDIRLAGDLIQSLAIYLNLSELQVSSFMFLNITWRGGILEKKKRLYYRTQMQNVLLQDPPTKAVICILVNLSF